VIRGFLWWLAALYVSLMYALMALGIAEPR
jgi:hypothetical protein